MAVFAVTVYSVFTTMYPEMEEQCSEINAFVYPKTCKAYDYND